MVILKVLGLNLSFGYVLDIISYNQENSFYLSVGHSLSSTLVLYLCPCGIHGCNELFLVRVSVFKHVYYPTKFARLFP